MDEIEESSTLKKTLKIQQQNKQIIARLNSWGAQPSNLLETRHERFLVFLVEQGILTQNQWEIFNLEWETYLNDQLQKLEVAAQRAMARSQLTRPMPAPPNGGLIIPGG